MTGGEDEPVRLGSAIDRVVAHLREEEHGEDVGDVEPLADVALALSGCHRHDVPSDLLRAATELLDIHLFSCC